jgi:hypothetical protein
MVQYVFLLSAVMRYRMLRKKLNYMRSEVLTTVKMSILVFWVVTPCGLIGRYQRFGGIYYLHLQG